MRSVTSRSMGPSCWVQILRASELPSATRIEKPACCRIALHSFVMVGSSSTTRMVGETDGGPLSCCHDIVGYLSDSIVPNKVHGERIHVSDMMDGER